MDQVPYDVSPLVNGAHLSGHGIELVVEDLMLTTSGALVLLLGDPADAIEQLREKAAARWGESQCLTSTTVCFQIIRNLETMHD